MNRQLMPLLFLLAAAIAPVLHAQEVAGRVLVAAGDLTILRGQEKIAGKAGIEVRTGDTLQLGAQSNAQVLLTDKSIIALRPETTFRIADYSFQNAAPEQQHAFFDLIKGGLRSVSGLIGKIKPENYSLRTPSASIGIRGTNYSVVMCDNSCRGADGALAPNGTYGTVTEGRISVTNQAGEQLFGADQYFRVSSQTSKPEQLIAPPSFLRDKLEGRARVKQPVGPATAQAQAQQESSGQAAQQGTTSPTGDTSVAATVASTTLSPTINTNVFQSTANASADGPTTLAVPASGIFFYRATAPTTIPTYGCTTPPCGSITLGEITLAVSLTQQRAGLRANFLTDKGEGVNLSTPAATGNDGIVVAVVNGRIVLGGTFNIADYPLSQASFRCQACSTAVPGVPGFLNSFSVSGVITGSQAVLNLVGIEDDASVHTFSVNLTQTTLPNNYVAAMVMPRQAGGSDSRVAAYWDVSLGASGELLSFGPSVGATRAAVGTASNVIAGSAPAAGNLVWGYWQGSGAQITDFNYTSFTTTSGTEPWITGQVTSGTPPSLGSVTYTPIAGFVNGGTGTLNSGTLTADFLNRKMSIDLNATNVTAGNTFQMNGASSFADFNNRFSSGFSSVSCSGHCSQGTPNGSYSGFFAGPNAEGAGVSFTAGYGTGNGVSGVAAFKR